MVDGENASEKKRRKVWHEPRSEETANDANAHAKGPKQGDGRVFPYITVAGNPLNPHGTQNGKHHGRPNRIATQQNAKANTAEWGMGDASTDEDQSAGNNISSDNSAQNACQQRANQGILKKIVL